MDCPAVQDVLVTAPLHYCPAFITSLDYIIGGQPFTPPAPSIERLLFLGGERPGCPPVSSPSLRNSLIEPLVS